MKQDLFQRLHRIVAKSRWAVVSIACLTTVTMGCSSAEDPARNSEPAPGETTVTPVAELDPPDGVLPRDEWPQPVVELVQELNRQQIEPSSIEVRPVNPEDGNVYYDGFYWRMPADAATVQAHVELFDLEEASAGSDLTSPMLDFYPAAWPRPPAENVTWYAWPYNRDDDGISAHFWEIMVHDHESETLTLFYWMWDINT
jgi:hypothetical protein